MAELVRRFAQASLGDVLRARLAEITNEIKALDADYVLKASATELEQHYLDKATLAPLVLDTEGTFIADRSGVDVDVSNDFNRAVFPGERAIVRGTRLDIAVPCSGDRGLWRFSPNPYSLSGYPEIRIHDQSVHLSVTFPDDSADSAALKGRIDSDVKRLAEAVASIKNEVTTFNAALPAHIKNAIDARRARANETLGAVSELGIPMRRADPPPAYAVPATRRAPKPRLPGVETRPYEAEPFLPTEEYEHILEILRSMSMVIERNSRSFSALGEEDIRNHFLLQLNGHYEGNATGETFNAAGKTDVLIRERDRNLFIAECKFWKGPRAFDGAISQLLSYLSWRDSKCALLVFNRNRDSSAVAQKMHDTMAARPECRKYVGKDVRGDNRYTYVKESDPGREITITTMLFDVAAAAATECGE